MSEELPEPDPSGRPAGIWPPTLEVWENQRQAHRGGGLPDDPRSLWVRAFEVVVDNLIQAAVLLAIVGPLLFLIWLARN